MDLLSISATKYLYFIGGIMTTELFRRLWKQWIRFYDPDRRREVHDVIFFPDKAVACKDFFENFEKCSKIQCSFSHEITGLRKLLSYIKSAKKSIDLCVFCISCHELVDAVIQRHKVQVRVRVITDNEMEEKAAGSQHHRFMKDGIIVRSKKSPFLMHHKYVIIDDRILIMGSFNWTSQAIMGNSECLLVTSDEWAVKPFSAEFQRLWDQMNSNHS